MSKIKEIFRISSHATGTFKFLGLSVNQLKDEIRIDQAAYIASLTQIPVTLARRNQKEIELTREEKSKLRSISGQILWVTGHTRPDMAFQACNVSNYGKKPTIQKILEANKAIKKMTSTNLSLRYPNLGDTKNIKVVCYSDATHASLPCGASQGAHIIFLYGENGKILPISWQSKKLRRVTKSPLASETLALSDAADGGYLISTLLQETFRL